MQNALTNTLIIYTVECYFNCNVGFKWNALYLLMNLYWNYVLLGLIMGDVLK